MHASDVASVICSFYKYTHDAVRREIAELDDDALNWRPATNANSIAALVTHLTGSEKEALTVARGLQSERDRPREFEMGQQSRQSLLKQLDLANRVLESHGRNLTEDDLSSPRAAVTQEQIRRNGLPSSPDLTTGLDLLIWNVAHAREHLGQLLLTKQLFIEDRERSKG